MFQTKPTSTEHQLSTNWSRLAEKDVHNRPYGYELKSNLALTTDVLGHMPPLSKLQIIIPIPYSMFHLQTVTNKSVS